MTDKTLRFNVVTRDTNTRRTLDAIADSAKDAGDEFSDMAKDAARLDDEIGDLERQIQSLKRAMIGVSGDQFRDMDKSLRGLEGSLRRRMNLKSVFSAAGDDAAGGFIARWSAKVGPAILSGPITPALGAAAVAAAPLVASGISAGVTAGLAGGAVAGGVALAFKDPQVAAAGKGMADRLSAVLADAASPFRAEMLDSFDEIEGSVRSIKPVLRDVFADSARYVQPLTNALTGFARNLAPGVATAVREAEPLFELVEEHGPAAGRTLSDSFKQMARSSKEASDNLDGLLTGVEAAVAGTSVIIGGLSKYSSLLGTGPLAMLGALSEKQDDATKAANDHRLAVASLNGGLSEAEQRARNAANELATYAQAAQDAASETLGLWDATTRYEAAQDAAAESARENGKTLDANTEKGRANRDALSQMAAAANAASLAAIAKAKADGNSTSAMNTAYTSAIRYREGLIKAIMSMGKTREEAEKMADEIAKVPRTIILTASVNGIPATIGEINRLKGYIDSIPRYKSVTIEGNVRVSGGSILRQHGGPVEAGRPYIVGEKRAELFVPNQSGRILPRVPAGAARGGVQTIVHEQRLILEWPDGKLAAEIVARGFGSSSNDPTSAMVEAVRKRFGTRAALGIQGQG